MMLQKNGEGGGGTPNSAGEGVWTYSKAVQEWFKSTAKVGNNTNFSPDSSTHSVAQTGATVEVRQDLLHSHSRGSGTAGATKRDIAGKVLPQPLGKRGKAVNAEGAVNRWEGHKKDTCKCAVCMQCRGELRSSWYKHKILDCACAVCRQARGESKHKGGSGYVCTPSIPSKRASWLPIAEPTSERRASGESRCGGGQQQGQFPFCSSQQSTSCFSCNNVVNSSVTTPPIRSERCTTTGIPSSWQQKLENLAREHTGYSAARGIPPTSSTWLPPNPNWDSQGTRERFTWQQRVGCSYCPENFKAEQQRSQTNFFSESRCSGCPDTHLSSANLIGSNRDGAQHFACDCIKLRRPPAVSSNCRTGLPWQSNVNRRQDAAGTSVGLHNAAESPLPSTRNLDLNLERQWEAVDASCVISDVTERDAHWGTYPNLRNMTKCGSCVATVHRDPFLSLGQSTCFRGDYSSSMAYAQTDAAPHPTIFPEVDFRPVYIPFQSSNSPRTLSGRPASVDQFPFGLEVQAEAEHVIYQPVSELQAPMHTQSTSFNFDEGTTESSSPPCETTSTTSVLNEKESCYPVMDVDSGCILRSSSPIEHGSPERLLARTDVAAGAHAGDQQLQSRCVKEGQGNSIRRISSKRVANRDDSKFSVDRKRVRREGVSRAAPKWCQFIRSKNDHHTIMRKIYIRSRVPKRYPQTPLSIVPEPSVRIDEKNCSAGIPGVVARGNINEGRSPSAEAMASSSLQRMGPTGVRESTNWKEEIDALIPSRRVLFPLPEEAIEEPCESMSNEDCTRKPSNSKGSFETSIHIETEDSPRDIKIIKLNGCGEMSEGLGLQCAALVLQCNGSIHDESEETQLEFPSLNESLDCGKDTSMILGAKTPELVVGSTELVRFMGQQSGCFSLVHSHAWVQKEQTSLCSVPRASPVPSSMLRRALKTYLGPNEQSGLQESFIPLRNIHFSYWIDKPLGCSIRVTSGGIILETSPPWLFSSDAAGIWITSKEHDRKTKSHCKQISNCCSGEVLEDDVSAGRQHNAQCYSPGLAPEANITPSVSGAQASVYKLEGHKQTPGSSAFHGECIISTKGRSSQTPSSFQDLLKSVIDISINGPPALSNNFRSGTDPQEGCHWMCSNECSKSIAALDVWEHLSDLRKDVSTPEVLTSSCDSISKPAGRRRCPKGGWQKKRCRSPAASESEIDSDKKYSLRSGSRSVVVENHVSLMTESKAISGPQDLSPAPPVDHPNTISQNIGDAEADLEVIHPTNFRSPKRPDSEYKMKLQTFLDRPFQQQELRDLEVHAFQRKPLLRLRETRHRVLHVATKKEGMSYLDYHPDLARKIADAAGPDERLRLLRGFIFWLQHSCISGSFKPWAPDVDEVETIDDDCVEIPKERFVGLSGCQNYETVKEKKGRTSLPPRRRRSKRTSASKSSKSKYFTTQPEPSREATIKKEGEKGTTLC